MASQHSPGDVWISRYVTGARVVIIEVDGDRIRIADINGDTGTRRVGKGRWATAAQLERAYRKAA
ncbi:hypothetical protein [Streptomyces sp. NPDC096033]|uniref:hypothetical protein n=1 Tax=Streptomyces sp. NPDC096033 TaxID=3366071 RepID=UPI003804E1A9